LYFSQFSFLWKKVLIAWPVVRRSFVSLQQRAARVETKTLVCVRALWSWCQPACPGIVILVTTSVTRLGES
jgi:hypothetical protein